MTVGQGRGGKHENKSNGILGAHFITGFSTGCTCNAGYC